MDDSDRLLAYAQGRLSEGDAQAFEQDLSRRPDLRAELTSMQAAVSVMGAVGGDAKAAGWDRLSASLDAESAPVPANDNRRLSLLQAAGIAVAAVAIWQFAAVPFLPGQPETTFTPASEGPVGPALRVGFAPTATLDDMMAILREVDGVVSDGPSAVGLFTVTFPDDAALDAAESVFAARTDMVIIFSQP